MSHPSTTERPRYAQIVIVSQGRWTLFGRHCGPRVEFAVEVSYDAEVGFRYQRCDGRPLGKIAGALKQKLELAQVAVMREFKSKRPYETARIQRSPPTDRATRPQPGAPQAAAPQAVASHAGGQPLSSFELPGSRPTGSFLKPNREVPTDRQRSIPQARLVSTTPAPISKPAPAPAIDDLANDTFAADFGLPVADELLPEAQPAPLNPPHIRPLTEIRERVVTPFRGRVDEDLDTTPIVSKTTSSIFRVDRQAATDRIAKLRKAPVQAPPAENDPFADDHAADLKPLMDELTTRMRRRRLQ